MAMLFYILDLSIRKQWRILMSLFKMFSSFSGNFILKSNSQLTLPRPSQRTLIHFMKRIYWMMIFQDFLKMGRIFSRPNWNLARSLNVLSVERNAKSLVIQSILVAIIQLTSSLLHCACAAKKQGPRHPIRSQVLYTTAGKKKANNYMDDFIKKV